jgi:hypothetical protein
MRAATSRAFSWRADLAGWAPILPDLILEFCVQWPYRRGVSESANERGGVQRAGAGHRARDVGRVGHTFVLGRRIFGKCRGLQHGGAECGNRGICGNCSARVQGMGQGKYRPGGKCTAGFAVGPECRYRVGSRHEGDDRGGSRRVTVCLGGRHESDVGCPAPSLEITKQAHTVHARYRDY